ncbi:distal tail protein Dit [Priestia megaterium]|uniref:distal tail protein Dit n=1 Tax=Priestia megaterium TaxID=1404 RepID=UPI000BFA60C8|nr:distal tail protein Dit [Priestia megaterium]PFW43804.1 hypothetical protein COL17_26730 [Priestia megaterium]
MIEYGGLLQPSFLRVTGVEVSMPDIDMQTMTVPKRMGAVYYGYEMGGRTVSLDVTLVKQPYRTLEDIERELASWLFPFNSGSDNPFSDLQRLYLDDNQDRYLMVRVSNTVSIKDLVTAGEGTIEFFSPSSFYFDTMEIYDTRTLTSTGSTSNNLTYNGSYDVYPYEITVTMDATVSGFTIRNDAFSKGLTINKTMNAGDVLTIYPDKREVYINGVYSMKYLVIGSRFPILLANRQNTFITTLASGKCEIKSKIIYL